VARFGCSRQRKNPFDPGSKCFNQSNLSTPRPAPVAAGLWCKAQCAGGRLCGLVGVWVGFAYVCECVCLRVCMSASGRLLGDAGDVSLSGFSSALLPWTRRPPPAAGACGGLAAAC